MSRTRPRRGIEPAAPAPVSAPSPSRPRRAAASANLKIETETSLSPSPATAYTSAHASGGGPGDASDQDAEGEEDDGQSDLTPEPGPSNSRAAASRGRGRAHAGSRNAGRGRGARELSRLHSDMTGADSAEEGGKGMRSRKSVSYKEEPIVAEDDEDENEDEDAEGEDEDAEGEDTAQEVATPRQRSNVPASPRGFEKIGSGRGGFSVKGAAAAAARARWAKYRNEKAERGDDDDDDRPRRQNKGAAARQAARDRAAAADQPAEGTTVEIKGKEYLVGDDELVLEDDEKGEKKVNADGQLLGGREYKLVTFTSESRKNPNRVYALTIDAARACGYTDSLAFLRRCPQLLKLACNAEERQMLIDIGRVTGNLKHRMVTMVAMRNVYKLMGTRVVKNGKWVTDDYNEEKALADCTENGFTPHAVAHDDEILANALALMQPQGRPAQTENFGVFRATNTLTPFYTLGGPTTHFAGAGSDPWSESGWGNKRQKLKGLGVTEEDWMYRTALETRRVDETLREYRDERLVPLEGKDLEGWVYRAQKIAEGEIGPVINGASMPLDGQGKDGVKRELTAEWLKPPAAMERQRSSLSQEITPLPSAEQSAEARSPAEGAQEDADVDDGVERTPGGKIIVQSEAEAAKQQASYNWGVGSWEPGVAYGVYEPHTHLPHVPLHTQPRACDFIRISHNPVVSSIADDKHRNFAQSTIEGIAARGLASVEYVFAGTAYSEQVPALAFGRETEDRLRLVIEAEEWEKEAKRRRSQAVTAE